MDIQIGTISKSATKNTSEQSSSTSAISQNIKISTTKGCVPTAKSTVVRKIRNGLKMILLMSSSSKDYADTVPTESNINFSSSLILPRRTCKSGLPTQFPTPWLNCSNIYNKFNNIRMFRSPLFAKALEGFKFPFSPLANKANRPKITL